MDFWNSAEVEFFFSELGHGREHENMDANMKTWTRTWKHGRGHEDMDADMETWTRTPDMETR